MKDYEIEFYAQLGLLSVKFAQMEYKLSTILGKLFGTENDLIPVTVMEKNSLSKNIELLRKLNKIRKFQYSLILDLISQKFKAIETYLYMEFGVTHLNRRILLKLFAMKRKLDIMRKRTRKGLLLIKPGDTIKIIYLA